MLLLKITARHWKHIMSFFSLKKESFRMTHIREIVLSVLPILRFCCIIWSYFWWAVFVQVLEPNKENVNDVSERVCGCANAHQVKTSITGSHGYLHKSVCIGKPEIPNQSVHVDRPFNLNINYCRYYYHIFVCLSLRSQPCLHCRVFVSLFLSFIYDNFSTVWSLWEGAKQPCDAQRSSSQEACLPVCSTRVTVDDLRRDQGGLRLSSTAAANKWSCQSLLFEVLTALSANSPSILGWGVFDVKSFGKRTKYQKITFFLYLHCIQVTFRQF